MRTLIPEAVSGTARPLGSLREAGSLGPVGRRILLGLVCLIFLIPGYWVHTLLPFALVLDAVLALLVLFDLALTTRGLLLLLAGLLALVPAFFHPQRLLLMVAWDGLLLAVGVWDAVRLPAPKRLRVRRTFLDSPRLGERTVVELELVQESSRVLEADLTDGLEASLLPVPLTKRVEAFPRDPVRATLECFPGRRGEVRLGNIFLRYRSGLKLVERRAVIEAAQEIRVFPAMEQGSDATSLYLMRARQIELQKRRLKMRGIGREFESLRDYVRGDEIRNISWTATARRLKPIVRQYTTERSQQVWVVLDAGRLSRTAFEMRKALPDDASRQQQSEQEQGETLLLTVTQLDQAATAAVMLAEAVGASGDKCGLLTYGREVQQQLLPGAGPAHLRTMIDQLSQVRGEAAEANHLNAAARLKHLQRRRGLIVWITEVADSAGRPEIVAAAVELVRRHLVLLVLLEHPELEELATRKATTVEGMYASAAAKEMLDRRRETIAKLRQQGVLVIESTPGEVGMRAINGYLDVKGRGLL